MSFLKTFFTWWNGATFGIHLTAGKGRHVGTDEFGNRYYEARTDRDSYDRGRKRRYVIYKGYADASKVTPDWHGWLHYTFDEPPTEAPFQVKAWEKPHVPNMTGTIHAYRPKGALSRGGERQRATGDYEAWTPD